MIRVCKSCGQKNRVRPEHLAATTRCGKCKASLGPVGEPVDADTQVFDEVVRSARVPVLVDFWAAWCGPCHMAAPEVQKVAEAMAGRAIVLKVDTDKHPEIAGRYKVQGIPNFVVIKDGTAVFQQAGVVAHTEMRRWLETAQSARHGAA
jgi:thioredoxin 2